jgi:membrane protein implicated in regulation of membrane protease activity
MAEFTAFDVPRVGEWAESVAWYYAATITVGICLLSAFVVAAIGNFVAAVALSSVSQFSGQTLLFFTALGAVYVFLLPLGLKFLLPPPNYTVFTVITNEADRIKAAKLEQRSEKRKREKAEGRHVPRIGENEPRGVRLYGLALLAVVLHPFSEALGEAELTRVLGGLFVALSVLIIAWLAVGLMGPLPWNVAIVAVSLLAIPAARVLLPRYCRLDESENTIVRRRGSD